MGRSGGKLKRTARTAVATRSRIKDSDNYLDLDHLRSLVKDQKFYKEARRKAPKSVGGIYTLLSKSNSEEMMAALRFHLFERGEEWERPLLFQLIYEDFDKNEIEKIAETERAWLIKNGYADADNKFLTDKDTTIYWAGLKRAALKRPDFKELTDYIDFFEKSMENPPINLSISAIEWLIAKGSESPNQDRFDKATEKAIKDLKKNGIDPGEVDIAAVPIHASVLAANCAGVVSFEEKGIRNGRHYTKVDHEFFTGILINDTNENASIRSGVLSHELIHAAQKQDPEPSIDEWGEELLIETLTRFANQELLNRSDPLFGDFTKTMKKLDKMFGSNTKSNLTEVAAMHPVKMARVLSKKLYGKEDPARFLKEITS